MTAQGDRTKALLIHATLTLITEVGYQQATTKTIAQRAGVSEGTIYRHYPDKRALFFAAVLAAHQPMLDWMTGLPGRAGTAPLADILTTCLLKLAELRASVIPLELTLLTEPELSVQAGDSRVLSMAAAGGPPHQLAQYLAAEQRLGRIRSDQDPDRIAVLLLAALFGLGANPLAPSGALDAGITHAVSVILEGIAV